MCDTAQKKFPSYFHFISLKSRQEKCAKGKKKIYIYNPLEIFFCSFFFFSHQSQDIKRIFRYLLVTDHVLEILVSSIGSNMDRRKRS